MFNVIHTVVDGHNVTIKFELFGEHLCIGWSRCSDDDKHNKLIGLEVATSRMRTLGGTRFSQLPTPCLVDFAVADTNDRVHGIRMEMANYLVRGPLGYEKYNSVIASIVLSRMLKRIYTLRKRANEKLMEKNHAA